MQNITRFEGIYAFLNNFHPSSIIVPVETRGRLDKDGKSVEYVLTETTWPDVEHLFQAMKTLCPWERETIRLALTPAIAKRRGRKVALRPDWEPQVKKDIMFWAVQHKFMQNPDLRTRLSWTKNARLIEGNYWHDNYWGDCYCPKCRHIIGQDQLGKTLMRVRNELC